jgi:hypothetical protein
VNLINLKHWALIVYQQHLEREQGGPDPIPVQLDRAFVEFCLSKDGITFMEAFGDPKHELHSAVRAVCNEARAQVGMPPCKPI